MWRSKRRGLLRNAAIVLGNQRDNSAVPALARALADEEPLIRSSVAWALGQIGGETARAALQASNSAETNSAVRAAINLALQRLHGVDEHSDLG
jgi:epoxyqueuosine reductase